MRALAVGAYTDDQINAQLRAGVARIGCRYEVLDNNLGVLGELGSIGVDADGVPVGNRGVYEAAVENAVDQQIKGALDLRMLPDEDMRDRLFTRKIKPYWRIKMPDGGWAEWPQGVYVWTVPDRVLGGVGVEEWNLTLGDQTIILAMAGPGRKGFTVHSGQRVTDAIKKAVRKAGFGDVSGVVDSDEEVTEAKTWVFVTRRTRARRRREFYEAILQQNAGPSAQARAVRYAATQHLTQLRELAPDADNQRVTWMEILTDLHDSIGYNSPWFDADGLYRATPARDLQTEGADVTLATEADGLLLSVQTGHQLDQCANRVLVRSSSTPNPLLGVADANWLAPAHPMRQSAIGFYRDLPLDDQVAGSVAALTKRATRALHRALSSYETAETPSLAWPVHDPYDIIGVRWDGDIDFGTERVYHQGRYTLDLFDGSMQRSLRRVFR